MFGKKKKEEKKKKIFVDLDDYHAPEYTQSDAGIKVVEVTLYNDLRPLMDMAYRGNILILDFSRFADGDNAKREIAKRLLAVAEDINGSFTEASDRIMVMSPGGMCIDKCKITHKAA
jgi:Uncharacterized conserved protein